jgi:hypothetical protein
MISLSAPTTCHGHGVANAAQIGKRYCVKLAVAN